MKKIPPKYSIVIPTRNKNKYLHFALESVLSTGRTDVEVIVSNNYSTDGTASYLSTISDSRLNVVQPPTELPMARHYEFALSQASGEWVTLLGDDDAVMPYIFERLDQYIEKYNHISVISGSRAYFFWPGCEDMYGDKVVQYHRGNGIFLRSTKLDLLSALAGLRSCFDLPQIYTSCIVKKSLVEKVKFNSGGRFYYSIIPDMYSAVSICLTEDLYLRTEEPLFWTGTSSSSMGRSDRIYLDSEIEACASTGVPDLKLHPSIPKDIHILGFGSLYLYEALVSCPFASRFWRSTWIEELVYADLFRQTRKQWSRIDLQGLDAATAVYSQINALNLSVKKLKGLSVLVNIFIFFNKIIFIPKRIIKKFSRIIRKDYLLSSDRAAFDTINKASDAINMLVRNR